MKVLLINPMIPTMPKGTRCLSTGLLWIGSYLKQKGHEVKMINIRNEPNYIDLIKREIKNSSCVGVTAMTAQIPNALEVCQIIKEKDSSIPIVWGGVHPTLYPKGTVEDELIDVSCEGEGEYPILELVKHFEKGGDLKNIDGISYKKNGEIIQNKPGKNFDLDELNHVYWELLDKKIMRKPETFEFPIHTSRGCPHRCTFCVNVVTQNFWRSRNPEKVVQDLEGIRDLGVSEIRFRDENFFVNKDLVKKITGEMIKREMKFKWYGSIRVDYLKPNHINMNIIKQVKQSGCQWLAFGAESGSQRILDILKKDITPEETLKSARICREVGIKPVYSFIIGIPGETKKDVFMSLNLIDKLKKICPKARINGPQILRVYPGGELYIRFYHQFE